MAVIPYDRITNLQNDQALNPTDPYPAPDMDAEYNALKITTDDLIQHLDLIQRDDGELENNSVGFDQLREEVLIGFDAPAAWITNHDYAVGNTVFEDDGFYYCNVAHLSGVFATDLAAGKWSLVADFAQSTEDAQAAAAAAAASAAAAATDADQAQAAAAEATAAQGAFRWNFSTSTAMTDPGIGNIRGNGTPASSMTQIAVSANTADAGNPGIMPWLVTWDDSTNTTSRGTLYVRKVSAPQNFAVFDLTGTVVNNGAWAQIGVTYVTHAGILNNGDPMSVAFMRTGNAGTSGSGTGDMLRANNLGDVVSVPSSRTNLGLGTTDAPTFSLVTLSNQPTVNTHGANKLYVDTAIGGAASLTVSDTPPVGKPDGALWWESDAGQLYVRYNDGSSTQWVVATPQPDFSQLLTPSQGVRYDVAQSLSAAQQTQARSNVYAAPFDAMSYSGMQINGGMEVSQESGTTAITVAAGTVTKQLIDGCAVRKIGTNAFTVQQVASVFPGYNNALKLTVTTAQASIGSDAIYLEWMVEGYRFARAQWGTASAQPVTIGFWVKSSVAGSLPVQIINNAINLAGVGTVTIVTANVAQWVTLTIAATTTGTWETTNGTGARISIIPAIGGNINIAATNGNTFEITGLVVLPGSQAPTAAQSSLVMRPYDQELVACQRYYSQLWVAAYFVGAANSFFGGWLSFKAIMRSAPTVTPLAGYGATNLITAPYTDAATVKNDGFRAMARSNGAGDAAFNAQFSCDARL